MRVDMTLADAEDLVESLRSLIAAAKEGVPGQNAAQPTALALAGLKIGAEPKAAPPRFSNAQLEAISRQPVRRGLNLSPDGRILHSLNTPASLHRQPLIMAQPSRRG
jgi:hypothetical protein